MFIFRLIATVSLLTTLVMLGGCAPTNVQVMEEYSGQLPRPERVLVYDFALSLDDINLAEGIGADIKNYAKGTPKSVEERRISRAIADAMSEELVKKIQAMGMPAQRAYGSPPVGGHDLLIHGRFLDVDQGNESERMVIGLGLGASEVTTHIDVYEMSPDGKMKMVTDFRTTAKSVIKPGMAETMGVGALAGNLAVSAAVSATANVGSQVFEDSITAEAKRTADKVSEKLVDFFSRQGWI